MDIHTNIELKNWTGKVKLNVVERKYSPKRIIQLPVSCQLPKGDYNIAISASETMDIPKETSNVESQKTINAGKRLYEIFASHFKDFKKALSPEERKKMNEIAEVLENA